MSGKNQYVVRNGDAWGASRGRQQPTHWRVRHPSRLGREIARNQGAELRIQGRDGRFREAWSYGSDPYPPEG